MQATHSKCLADSVARSEGSVTHNEGANDDDCDEWDEWDEVLGNQWQQRQYQAFLLGTGKTLQSAHVLLFLVTTEDSVGC